MNVICLGGSVIEKQWDNLDELTNSIEKLGPCVVVTGAGSLKRYIEKVEGKCNESEQDELGIKATRLNAELVRKLIDKKTPRIPTDLEETVEKTSSYGIVVTGGFMPGFSTDAVAALIAERLEAELYILKDVEGIYSGNPEREESELLENASVDKIRSLKSDDYEAGEYGVLDSTALDLIERSNISSKVMEGTVENIENPVDAPGTRILP